MKGSIQKKGKMYYAVIPLMENGNGSRAEGEKMPKESWVKSWLKCRKGRTVRFPKPPSKNSQVCG